MAKEVGLDSPFEKLFEKYGIKDGGRLQLNEYINFFISEPHKIVPSTIGDSLKLHILRLEKTITDQIVYSGLLRAGKNEHAPIEDSNFEFVEGALDILAKLYNLACAASFEETIELDKNEEKSMWHEVAWELAKFWNSHHEMPPVTNNFINNMPGNAPCSFIYEYVKELLILHYSIRQNEAEEMALRYSRQGIAQWCRENKFTRRGRPSK